MKRRPARQVATRRRSRGAAASRAGTALVAPRAAALATAFVGGFVALSTAFGQPDDSLILPPSADAEPTAAPAPPVPVDPADTSDAAGASAAAGAAGASGGPGVSDAAAASDAVADPAPTTESADATGSAARLAAPDPERAVPIEEVIVISEIEWRLPDLGSEWRRAQEEADQGDDRIELAFFPLYDPENADPNVDLFERNSGLHQQEMIEVIRFRFGGRSRD